MPQEYADVCNQCGKTVVKSDRAGSSDMVQWPSETSLLFLGDTQPGESSRPSFGYNHENAYYCPKCLIDAITKWVGKLLLRPDSKGKMEMRRSIQMTNHDNEHKSVEVFVLPTCDFCEDTAKYDGKTKIGPWASMCEAHFKQYGIGLGLGRGQEFILRVD